MSIRGFTLIELLVVVLIIAILAAIALPQYRRSVLKTKAKEAVLNLRPIAEAQKRYHLATGFYTEDMNELDTPGGRLKYYDEYIFHDEHVEVMGTYEGVEYWITVFFNETETTYCGIVGAQTSIANPCEILSEDKMPRGDLYDGYLAYRM